MRYLSLIAATLLVAGCASTPAPLPPAAAPAQPSALVGPHGFDVGGMDTNVRACDDFYTFAVGNWRKSNPLPAAFSRYGRFEQLEERNRTTLHAILEQAAADTGAQPGSPEQKIGAFYAACMNETAVNAAGSTPIQADLADIDAIHDTPSLLAEITRLHQKAYAPLFRVSADNDYKNSKMMIAVLEPGALGLPDRDYYLRDDERFRTIRTQYVEHVAKMLALAGESPDAARTDADLVLQLETRLASAELSRVDQRNPDNIYHMMPVTDLAGLAPAVNFPSYLQTLGVDQPSINVSEPKYVQTVETLIGTTSLPAWKAYLKSTVINAAAPTLSQPFEEEAFNFSGRTLSGQKQQQPRWVRCVRATDMSLGQLLGQEYVRRNFTPEAKAKMNSLIDNLVEALREDIPTLTWMGPETKQAALTKLDAFRRRIGYPDTWIDYSALNITPTDTYAADVRAARQFSVRRNLGRIGKPDDPNEWGWMTPPTVNAMYNPSQNNITFPAGILQPPFYDPNADDAYNYGGIGTVIGHEMTHGFDDEGARFDAEGNLRDWWTAQDMKNFQERAACIVDEYSGFNVAPAQNGQPAININGKLVTGEAIADLGGATLALRAYEKSLQGRERKVIDGFTPEQRFFLGFAQVWGENMAPQEQTRRALIDPHAQGPFRINGTVKNMPEFQKAFHCPEGASMVAEGGKRCSIW